tara:strand:- start:37 stop:708 length:672 start_codon:yes stop_codon:yes gene_type:complete
MNTDYKNVIVRKPWGHEYLVYENEFVGLWFLKINYKQTTSFHCHPLKTSGLFVIDGTAEVSFFDNNYIVKTGQKIMIRKGLFHSTKSLSESGSLILEIETPKDKLDLVRLDDLYGRTAKPYEGKSEEIRKDENCVWIREPEKGAKDIYYFNDIKIKVENIINIDDFKKKSDNENLIFLRGGILCDKHNITQPGDIVSISTIRKLIKTFEKISPNTNVLSLAAN